MIPTIAKRLESLPLTPNGKLDRRALPDVRPAREEKEEETVEPVTPTETILVEIFCEVLGCAQIGTRTSLLDHGADSLQMFQIAARAHRRGFAVTVKQLMQLHTVKAVAQALESAAAENDGTTPSNVLRRVSREQYRVSQ
jgi:aryl carrier-like protein